MWKNSCLGTGFIQQASEIKIINSEQKLDTADVEEITEQEHLVVRCSVNEQQQKSRGIPGCYLHLFTGWTKRVSRRLYEKAVSRRPNPFTVQACKISGLKDARTRSKEYVFRSCNIYFQCYAFWWKFFHMPVRKRRQKGVRISNFALLLVVFNDIMAIWPSEPLSSEAHHGMSQFRRLL